MRAEKKISRWRRAVHTPAASLRPNGRPRGMLGRFAAPASRRQVNECAGLTVLANPVASHRRGPGSSITYQWCASSLSSRPGPLLSRKRCDFTIGGTIDSSCAIRRALTFDVVQVLCSSSVITDDLRDAPCRVAPAGRPISPPNPPHSTTHASCVCAHSHTHIAQDQCATGRPSALTASLQPVFQAQTGYLHAA